MNRVIILSGLLVSGVASATPYLGESVVYRVDSTHSYNGVVVNVVDSDEADLALYGHNTLWTVNSVTYTTDAAPVLYVDDVTRGSGDGQWLENPAMPQPGPSLITAQANPGFSLGGSAIQLNATRDTELSMSVNISLPLSLVAGATGTVHLFCDASATPSTEVETLARGNTGGLLTTDTATLQFRHRVRAGDYCKVTATQDVGSPTFSVVRQLAQTVD